MSDSTDVLDAPDTGASQDSPTGTAAGGTARPRRRASGGLTGMVLPELQALAAELGITGTGRMRKSQLIDAIRERQGGGTGVPAGGAVAEPAREAAPQP
ncbi:MAG: Rho termination factor N-terminal domain-containing protein, partial [Actinomycetota bacterium]|nr:Rho termination factor N-terminal domain-containing protein [Actinomycetota bacterium]